MNTSSEAAEQVIRLSLQGIEVAAKLSGSGAKNIAALLLAIAKDKQKVRGKTTLTNMLKSGRPLKVFSIKGEDLRKFSEEAKRYGVLYSAIVEKTNRDGMIDIMTREEDSPKINRIIERFKLATVDLATIQSEVEKIKDNKGEIDKGNPSLKMAEKKNQLENFSKSKDNLEVSTKRKPSVREEIKTIKKEMSKNIKQKRVRNKERKHIR